MLAIRMQRTGRKGHAMFRVIVQDSRLTPTSGRIVANLGSYDPHTKASQLEHDKASFYLNNGAQPSPRVIRLLQAEGVSLPKWVETPAPKSRSLRNADKLRKNRPAEEKTKESSPVKTAEESKPEPESVEAPEQTDTTTAVAEENVPETTVDETSAEEADK